MEIELEKGKKSEQDRVLLIHTVGWEQMTYEDLFKIVKLFYVNEDKIYPPPKFKGSKMLMETLIYLRTHSVMETTLESKLRKAEYLTDFM